MVEVRSDLGSFFSFLRRMCRTFGMWKCATEVFAVGYSDCNKSLLLKH